jgi:hypothetical protein
VLPRIVGQHLTGPQTNHVVHIGDGDAGLCGVGGNHDLDLIGGGGLEGEQLLLVRNVRVDGQEQRLICNSQVG